MNDERRRADLSIRDLRKLHHQMPRWAAILLAAGAAAVIASHITHLLITLMISAVLAYIMNSAVIALEARGIKRSMAVLQLFVLGAAVVASLEILFAPYLAQEISKGYGKLPEFSRQLEATLLSSTTNTAQNYPMVGEAIRKLVDTLIGPDGFLGRTLDMTELLTQAAPVIMGLILVPFFVFFLLKDWPGAVRKAMDWVPPSCVETTVSVIAEINILVGKYLRGLAADCISMGVLASLGLWLIGINNHITLGILTGLANVIPYLGPVIACSVSSLIALMQFNSFDAVLNVVLLYIVIKVIDDLFLQPVMIGRSVKLHPMVLVITIIVGENLFGIIGMILGVPVVTAAQKTVQILLEHRREAMRREALGRVPIQHLDKSPIRPI